MFCRNSEAEVQLHSGTYEGALKERLQIPNSSHCIIYTLASVTDQNSLSFHRPTVNYLMLQLSARKLALVGGIYHQTYFPYENNLTFSPSTPNLILYYLKVGFLKWVPFATYSLKDKRSKLSIICMSQYFSLQWSGTPNCTNINKTGKIRSAVTVG